jgi:hypothetical protein
MLSVLQVATVSDYNTFMLYTSAYSRDKGKGKGEDTGKGKGKGHPITSHESPEKA